MATASEDALLAGERFRLETSGRTPAFFSRHELVKIDAEMVEELKAYARSEDTDIRICLHDDPAASVHDMVILQRRGLYHRPHLHVGKTETWHVVDGVLGAFVFTVDGTVVEARRLRADGAFLYRIGPDTFHTVVPITPTIVYHESKPGPFLPGVDTVAASWAPAEEEVEAAHVYNLRLLELLDGDAG